MLMLFHFLFSLASNIGNPSPIAPFIITDLCGSVLSAYTKHDPAPPTLTRTSGYLVGHRRGKGFLDRMETYPGHPVPHLGEQ